MSVPDLLFGSTPAMVRVLDFCARFARTDYPIVIAGPPGSGKTVLARYIHELSGRTGDFLVCSLANVPRGLGESHLHGHRRGVFTGAYTDQRGMIEAAHQGTLFLEEIGLASDHSQGLLLDLFDNATARRVGDTRGRQVDLRIVAATNADLQAMCEAGTFRRDLLDRLEYLWVRLPPLSERRADVLPLMTLYLAHEAQRVGRRLLPQLSPVVRDALLDAPWEGNIRELRAVCRYLVVAAPADREAELADLPGDFLRTLGPLVERRAARSLAERARDAVGRCGGNKSAAARELHISRRHVYRLLNQAESPDTRSA